ncbi:MAG: CoA transferase [Actinomycetia bacterium]|nr:CoA transferase [Actinomycetes bacterium]
MGPLEGVRVVDVTHGPGRSAGHLLAGLGADVVRFGRGDPGPAMGSSGPLLEWWFDAGTRQGSLDLDAEDGQGRFRALAAVADLVIDDADPGWMVERGVGPDDLRAPNPALVHVSVTPFGSQGPRAGWRSSDLVAQAVGGWMSVTGNPDEPVALWGRQAWNLAGMYAAVEALAGLRQARRTGRGAWVDLSMHQGVVSCSEHVLMYWWHADALAPFGAPVAGRQRSLHWIRAFEVVPCERGHLMISPAAGGLLDLIAWLKERGFASDIPAEPTPDELVGLIEPMMSVLREAARAHDATELFEVGQSLHVPFGEAYAIPQVADCVQHQARGFFRPVEGGADPIRLPGPLGRFERTPVDPPGPPPSADTEVDEILAGWPAPTGGPTSQDSSAELAFGPLTGLRVLDFTHVLAGPFASRVMGDLGADVIRLQTIERNAGTAADSFPYNVLWARNKRSIQLEMGHPGALDALRGLVEQADIVVDNFSAGVMARWGAGPHELRAWNPGIVTMSMSGCGAGGPWESYVTYAPTVHALSGFTALTGPEGDDGCGPGIAYNDHVSGLVGATLLLSAIRHRDETGEGQHIDVSQLEIGTWLTGPAVVDYLATGREARALGNRDPWADHVVNEVFRCADGEWLAVTVADEGERSELERMVGSVGALAEWLAGVEAEKAAENLQAVGIAAGVVQNARHLVETDPQLAAVDWLVDMESSMLGTQQTERHPARWVVDGREVELNYGPSPFLGEHNFEVYGELLGWDEVAVAEAMGDGLIQ